MFSDGLATRRPPPAPAAGAPVGVSIHAAATRAPRAQGTGPHSMSTQSTSTQSTTTQRTGSPPAGGIAPTSARHADGPRVPPSEIRDEPAVGNQPMRHPGAWAAAAQIRQFDSPRRYRYTQRTRLLAPGDSAPAPASHAAGPRQAVCDPGRATRPRPDHRPPQAQAVAAQIRHFNSPRRNPNTQRTRPQPPVDTAPARRAASLRLAPSVTRPGPESWTAPSTLPTRQQRAPRSAPPPPPATTRTPRGPARYHRATPPIGRAGKRP